MSGMATIFAIVGLIASILIAGAVYLQGTRALTRTAQAEVALYADALGQRTRIAQAYLRAVSARLRGADVITQEEFESFVGYLGPEPALNAVIWAPRVEGTARALYEARVEATGESPAQIVEREGEDYVPTRSRPAHYPIRFVAGRGADDRRVGFDLASLPRFEQALAEAETTRRTLSTTPGALPGGDFGFHIVEPIGSASGEETLGVVVGAFRLDLLTAAAAPASLITRDVVIEDLTSGTEPIALRPSASPAERPENWAYKDLSIGGRDWRVYLQPPERHALETALIVLLIGLTLTGISVVLADRGQQRLIAQDLKREVERQTAALQRSMAEFQALFEEGGTGKCELVPETKFFRRVNLQLCEMLGYDRDELVKMRLDDVLHPEDAMGEEAAYRSLLEGGSDAYFAEKRLVRQDGSQFWCEISATVLRDEADRPVWTVAVIQDITSRKQAEETRQLLVRELAHRVKNTLQVARSLADQTGRYVSDLPSFLQLYQGRLRALAMAHDQLFKTDWGGAHLEDIVHGTFSSFGLEPGERLDVDVPNVLLSSAETQTLALILNELATNAAKYGALSSGKGTIAIRATITEEADDSGETAQWLDFEWLEAGGPKVTKPEKPGFGMTFLTRAVQHQHGGSTGFDWKKSGVRYTLRLPLHKEEEDSVEA